MSEIALYNTLRKIPEVSDTEAKEAVADVASSREVATKSDIKELKAETKVDIKDMATKADIAEVKADIAEIRGDIAEIRGDIRELRAEIKHTRWVLGLLFIMNVAILAKLFF